LIEVTFANILKILTGNFAIKTLPSGARRGVPNSLRSTQILGLFWKDTAMLTRTKVACVAMIGGLGMTTPVFAFNHHNHSHLNLTANAAPVCTLSSPVASGSSVNAGYAMNSVTLTQLIDPTTALANDSSITLQIAHALCNHSAWLSLGSRNGGLTSSSGVNVAAGQFLTVVPYVAEASWGGLTIALDTGSGVKIAKGELAGANSGSLSLNIAVHKGATPVVQGTYSDVLTVKIGAPL
jgi:hypothetical protein